MATFIPTHPASSQSLRALLGVGACLLLLTACDKAAPDAKVDAKKADAKDEKKVDEKKVDAKVDAKKVDEHVSPSTETCLAAHGYVWNTTHNRCMDAAGTCNQGFVLNADKTNCDVNQAAVCALPDSDPLHGLCNAAPAEANKTDDKGCLVSLGYVWNTTHERCMDAAGTCNQGFVLDAEKANCEVNQKAVCMLPASDPLSQLCQAQPDVNELDAKGCLVNLGYVWNTTWERCMDPAGACNQGFVLDAETAKCEVNQAAVCALPATDPLNQFCSTTPPPIDQKDDKGCLAHFGYVWNPTHERCMDTAGGCNQGFLLNTGTGQCEVYQAVVCTLPATDPLHGLCKTP